MCLRRTSVSSNIEGKTYFCTPMENYNVFMFLPATNKSHPLSDNSVFVLASRMDSFSMFADMSPGADSALSNMVAMLSIIEALGRAQSTIKLLSEKNDKHLFLAFFNGESFDYIGSSRMIWEMAKDEFPQPLKNGTEEQPALFHLSNIAFFLELNQLALSGDGRLFLHVDPLSYAKADVQRQVEHVSSQLMNFGDGMFIGYNKSIPLPPASLQSFLKARPDLPGLVITDHLYEFSNKFYNSFMDQPPRINQLKFARVVKHAGDAILNLIFLWLNNGVEQQMIPEIDIKMVDTLLKCLLHFPDWNCTSLRQIIDSLPGTYPMQRTYIGSSLNRIFATYFSSFFLGNEVKKDECKDDDGVVNILAYRSMKNPFTDDNSSHCIASTVMISPARSPAFDIEDYDWKSGTYSTWAESVWLRPRMRIFLMSSPSWHNTVFGIGLSIFLLSIFITYTVKNGADILFASNISEV
ncbi:unnamed protein product [Soboliphyme baturini]|uniref:Nicastrin n=1 Tax=Soboliphyme baturini TaxID=241478 RepID=A0A183J1P1_9BILA|nr:unnamed protein product [Soboliphyme baturini]